MFQPLLLSLLVTQAPVPSPPPQAALASAKVEDLYKRFRERFDENLAGAGESLAALEAAFPGHVRTLDARKRFDAPAKTRPGLMAPAFSVPSLEDPKVIHSLDAFKGKHVLLEFWATWCPYCVADLPAVHQAWERFKGPGFEILSFSLDRKPADVDAFRKAKQPMPWKHAFLPGMKAHPVAEAYGAAGIPLYVLVGPEGRILASGQELRAERLEDTLGKFLNPSEDPGKAVLDEVRGALKANAEARQAHIKAGRNPQNFVPDFSALTASLQARLKGEQRPGVRQALAVGLYQLTLAARKDPDAALTTLLKQEVPSTAGAWALDAGLLPRFLETCFADPAAAEAFAAPGREGHPDPAVRAGLLMAQFEANLGAQDPVAEGALARLEREHPADENTKFARRLWDAQARTPVGAPAPAFQVPSLEDPKLVYSLDTFKGKYVLIDFWASWCPPCRAELPGVHRAWERFKDRNFVILSLSWDRKPEDIAAFRAKPGFPMPWKHAHLSGTATHPASVAYGVVGIPKPVLVGPDGRIVATDAKLRGENLERTLARVLEPSAGR